MAKHSSHNPYWRHIRDEVDRIGLERHAVLKPEAIDAALVTTALFQSYGRGEEIAYHSLLVACTEGIRADIRAQLKTSTTRVKLGTGTVLQLPIWIGVKVTDAEGRVVGVVQKQWVDAAWEEIEQFVQDEMARRDQADINIRGYGRVLDLHVRYPNTRTPREACKQAGLDWRNLDVPEVA